MREFHARHHQIRVTRDHLPTIIREAHHLLTVIRAGLQIPILTEMQLPIQGHIHHQEAVHLLRLNHPGAIQLPQEAIQLRLIQPRREAVSAGATLDQVQITAQEAPTQAAPIAVVHHTVEVHPQAVAHTQEAHLQADHLQVPQEDQPDQKVVVQAEDNYPSENEEIKVTY